MTQPDPSLPYDEGTDSTYADRAAQTFSVQNYGRGTRVLRGPCPRCHTVIDIPLVDKLFRASRKASVVDGRGVPMMCTCDDPHPDRPEGAFGCGAYWNLAVSEQQS